MGTLSKEELRTRIEAELLTGVDSRDLEEKYGVPYVTINGWKKKLFAEKPQESISNLTGQTKATLEIIRQKAKDEAPKVSGKIDKIIDGVEGLQGLEPEFQAAMHAAVLKAKEFLSEDGLSVKEWQMVTSTLAQAYSALFNKAGTTVNVAQTNISAEKEAMAFFQASKRSV